MKFGFTNHEQFKDTCAGIQSLSIAIAVIAGGLWSAYVFNSELKVENAKAQLKKIKQELETTANLEIDMMIENFSGSSDKARVLSVVTRIHNKGSRSTVLTTTDSALRAAKVSFSKEGALQIGKATKAQRTLLDESGELWNPSSKHIAAGETDSIPFLIRVNGPGIYLLTFEAKGLDVDSEDIRKLGAPPDQEVIPFVKAKYLKID